MARGAELPGVALRAEHREQVFESVAQTLGVIVLEFVDDLEEGTQRFRVAVRQIRVLEDVAEKRRNAGVLRHLGNSFCVEVQCLVTAETRAHQLGPAVASEVAREEFALASQLLGFGVHVIHELVDQRDGYLLDLALGIGHLAYENVAGGVDTALGVGIEHRLSLEFLDRRRGGEYAHLADGDLVQAFEALPL